MNISIFETANQLNQEVIRLIDSLLETAPAINISLSGGSTPNELFDYWAKEKQDSAYWQRIRLFWGDERCVAPYDPMSNYGTTKIHLLDKIPIPAGNVFRIKGENHSLQEATRYATLIDNEASPFDLVLLGLGNDGHTASIFPSCIELWDSTASCIATAHPESGMKRISITGKVINSAKQVAFLVTGIHKAAIVREIVQHRETNTGQYPAAKVYPQSGNLRWFLDKEAASQL